MVWTFALAAIAMCATVVFTLSPHGWRDLIWIVSFMAVFALAKIGLAQLLLMIMINSDDAALARTHKGPGVAQPAKLIPLNRDRKRAKRMLSGTATTPHPARRR